MAPGLKIVLVLGLIGSCVVLGSRPLGKGHPGMAGGQSSLRPDITTPVSLRTKAGSDGGEPAFREALSALSDERQNLGVTSPVTVSEGTGRHPRLPISVANLIKRQELQEVIEKYARHYGVDQDLVWAVIRQESGFNPQAVSPKGAMGLMQLMPGTAAMLGVSDAFDIEQNIAGGIKYLDRCLRQFNQDVSLALAAYNAGPDNVVKYQGCPPFAETQQYVASIPRSLCGEVNPGRPEPDALKFRHGC